MREPHSRRASAHGSHLRRAVKDVLFVCTDGLSGFPDAIDAVFPQAVNQTLDTAYGQRPPGLERPGDISERWPT
jgi:hypothetical protein